MRTNVYDYYIFDVDGTLYSLRKMRYKMFLSLSCYYLFHLTRIKELIGIYYFRKFRDDASNRLDSIAVSIRKVSDKINIKYEELHNAINHWMFDYPIEIIKESVFVDVIDFINSEFDKGKTIILYSDYPPEKKIKGIKVKYSNTYYPEKTKICEMKPSEKMMLYIYNDSGLRADKTLYVGDRDEKDGLSAKILNIKYSDINSFRKMIKK